MSDPLSRPAFDGVSDGLRAPARVLLVDDHRLFAETMTWRLRSEPEVAWVDQASSLPVAKALLASARPDVVLVDYDLDGVCGLDLLPDLARLFPRPAAIVLSGSEDVGSIIRGLRAGASGWVGKGGALQSLLGAIRTVLAGGIALPAAAWSPVVRALLDGPAPDAGDLLLAELTPRRAEVLRCLVAGMSQRETAVLLHVSENTVRTHVQGLLRQLGVHSTPALTALARRAGVTPFRHPEPNGSPVVPAQTTY